MRDEEYEFFTDCRDKKSTAQSAFKRRTHNGKGGRVRLPSDNLSKKELQKMNGEPKSYKLNDPMGWKEFKAMPDDIKVMYIKLLREKFNVPGRRIAEMMEIDAGMFAREIRRLGIGEGAHTRARNTPWNEEGWYAWSGAVHKTRQKKAEDANEENLAEGAELEVPTEEIVEEVAVEIPVEEIPVEVPKRKNVVPVTGNMVFEGLAEDVLESVRVLLGGGECAYQYHLGCTA